MDSAWETAVTRGDVEGVREMLDASTHVDARDATARPR